MRLRLLGTTSILALSCLSSGCSTVGRLFTAAPAPVAGMSTSTAALLRPDVQVPPVYMSTPQPSIDPVALAIAQSAQRIQQAVQEMKEITVASKLPDITPNRKAQMDAMNASVPPGLGSRISLTHDGEYTALVEAIAKAVGWSYSTEGNKPPVVQVVHKEYKQVRAVDVLRDIGYSVKGGSVILDSINRRVIVRFQS